MPRSKHTLRSLFAALCRPFTDAWFAEFGPRPAKPTAANREPQPVAPLAPVAVPDLATAAPPVVLVEVKPGRTCGLCGEPMGAAVGAVHLHCAAIENAAADAAPPKPVARKPRARKPRTAPAKTRPVPAASRTTKKPRAKAGGKPKTKGTGKAKRKPRPAPA